MFWGVGDVACGGVGVRILLPSGTVMCFSETGIATLDLRNPADDELVATILADSPAFRLVPLPLPLPSPSQTPPPRPPGTGSGVQAASEPNVAPVVLVVAGIATLMAGAAAVAIGGGRRD